jgi:hypothetical protein
MSIELEGLMRDVSDAGIVFMVLGGSITSMSFRKGKPSDSIMMRVKASKAAIEGYLRSNYSATRCFQCPHEDRCSDKTDCVHNRDGMSQGQGRAGTPPGIGSSGTPSTPSSQGAH